MIKSLLPILFTTAVFAQDVCPPRYNSFTCDKWEEIEDKIWYRQCTSQVLTDEGELKFSTTLETWKDKSNPNFIDVEGVLTIKHHQFGWAYYNYVHRSQMCPFPLTQVKGNVYWDWDTAYEWYGQNSTDEEWDLYQESGVNFGGMEWRTRNGFGQSGDLYFGCRKKAGLVYSGPVPSFSARDIEFDDRLWRYRFPEEENAIIDLEPPLSFDPDDSDKNNFAMNLRIRMSGKHVIKAVNGVMLDEENTIQIPNVVRIRFRARFEIMDPEYCPDQPEPPAPVYGDSSSDEIIP